MGFIQQFFVISVSSVDRSSLLRRLAGAILAAVVLAACGPNPIRTISNSGIAGQVFIGPMCPVVQEGTECPDRPYQATITVLNQSGREVLTIHTDASGQFREILPPGTYTLRPEPGEGIAHAPEQTVTVRSGQFTIVTITYDSGIR